MIFMQNNNTYTKQSDKRKKSQQKATAIFNKKNYKNISIRVKPDQAEEIRATAENLHQSLAQLIINAVRAYADIQTAGAGTPSGTTDPMQPEQPEQPENVTTESPMESEETAGAQPEEGAEETTARTEEEPQEDEDEDEKPEEIPVFVWEQIQRLKKADKKHTAERKAREAAERKRRRLGEESAEDY